MKIYRVSYLDAAEGCCLIYFERKAEAVRFAKRLGEDVVACRALVFNVNRKSVVEFLNRFTPSHDNG